MTHTRRILKFVGSALALATLAGIAFQTTAHADDTRTISFAHGGPDTDTGVNHAMKWWADELEERTDGSLSVDFFHMGALVRLADAVDGIRSGVADAGYIVPAYSQSSLPLWYLSTTNVGPGDEWVVNEAFTRIRERTPEIRDEEKRNNFHYLAHYSIGPSIIQSRDRPYLSPEAFDGDRVRLPGLIGNAARELGWRVTSVNLSFPDLYTGLERGTIDGTTSYLIHSLPYRHNEVAPHIVEPGLGQVTNVVFMNRRVFEQLTAEQRQVVEELTPEFNRRLAQGSLEDRLNAREELMNDPDYPVEFHEINEDQLAAWEEGFQVAHDLKVETASRWASEAPEIDAELMEELERVQREVDEDGYPWEQD